MNRAETLTAHPASLHSLFLIPNRTGHPSDPSQKLSDLSPEHCPNQIGTLSALNRNRVRIELESVSDLPRNTQPNPQASWKNLGCANN